MICRTPIAGPAGRDGVAQLVQQHRDQQAGHQTQTGQVGQRRTAYRDAVRPTSRPYPIVISTDEQQPRDR